MSRVSMPISLMDGITKPVAEFMHIHVSITNGQDSFRCTGDGDPQDPVNKYGAEIDTINVVERWTLPTATMPSFRLV